MNKEYPPPRSQGLQKQQKGYLLLEILVTVVVLSLGLLGVASMQYTGLRDNNRSNERSLATILAYDIIDRMRANRTGAQNGNYRIPAASTPPAALGSYNCITNFSGTTTANICSPDEMANADLIDWWTNALAVLPSGAASIICRNAAGNPTPTCPVGSIHTITIMWDDARGTDEFDCDPTADSDGDGQFDDDLTCMAVDVEL